MSNLNKDETLYSLWHLKTNPSDVVLRKFKLISNYFRFNNKSLFISKRFLNRISKDSADTNGWTSYCSLKRNAFRRFNDQSGRIISKLKKWWWKKKKKNACLILLIPIYGTMSAPITLPPHTHITLYFSSDRLSVRFLSEISVGYPHIATPRSHQVALLGSYKNGTPLSFPCCSDDTLRWPRSSLPFPTRMLKRGHLPEPRSSLSFPIIIP